MNYRSHVACLLDDYQATCQVDCIANMETHLKIFIDELSRVFFKKDNLRNKTWWLSAFYSFRIQSMVRRGLMELAGCQEKESSMFPDQHPIRVAVRQYLSIALRFFVAGSGTYDPLTKIYPSGSQLLFKTEQEKASDEHFRAAQEAVKQETWKSNGISSSMEYLQNLFPDMGEMIPERPSSSGS
jgi:hypothetical protein